LALRCAATLPRRCLRGARLCSSARRDRRVDTRRTRRAPRGAHRASAGDSNNENNVVIVIVKIKINHQSEK